MITEPNVEELLKKATNRYELVIAVSKRGRQIVEGKERKIKTDEKSEITVSALEFIQDKYKIKEPDNY